MRARQRPSGRGVIEGCAAPVRRAVTDLALLGESSCRVIRIVGPLKILEMTGDAGGAR